MNKLAIPILLILFTLAGFQAEAQQRTCGTNAHMDELLQSPRYAKAHHERQLKFESLNIENSMRTADCEEVLILPMAVHYQGIADPDVECLVALAKNQIQILNNDYQGVNVDITNWTGNAAASFPGINNGETCIQFCLARKNHPAGSGLQEGQPAITFNVTNGDEVPQWSGYINIFVSNIGGGILGYSPLGGTGLGDGVAIDNDYFSSGAGCAGVSPTAPYNLGRTLTHELGHYLNLNHIWGDGGCSVDDGVADTPTAGTEYYGCPNLGESSCGSTDMHMNYMDYVDDACMYMFSAGQSTRMENYANAGLPHLQDNVASVCGQNTIEIAALELIAPVNSENLGSTEMVSASIQNVGLDTIYSFSIQIDVNGMLVEQVTLDSTLAPGDIYVHNFTTPVDMDTVGSYEFTITTMTDGDVLLFDNTLNNTVEKLPRFDVAVTDVLSSEVICSDEVALEVMITNLGVEPLSSAVISYSVNGAAAITTDWTGNLAMGESEMVTLNIANLEAGTSSIGITVDSPNGETDEVPENNTFSKDFDINPSAIPFTLSLLTDNYPAETSWDLKDENGNTLYSAEPYAEDETQTTFTETWCLDSTGCYEFTIYDSFGDGIQYQGVEGYYEITNDAGEVVASLQEANFGAAETSGFCISCNLTGGVQTEPETDNMMDGTITVVLFGNSGTPEYSLDGGTPQSSNVFEGLTAGEYAVSVVDSYGCGISFDAVVDSMSTNTANLTVGTGVFIEPNPTNDLFTLKVEGLDAMNELDIEVFDAAGKILLETRATKVNDTFSKQISLGEFPEGLYFVRINKDEFSQMHKVIKF